MKPAYEKPSQSDETEATKENPFSKHTLEFREKAEALGHNVQELRRISKEIAKDTVGLFEENASEYYERGVKKAQKLEKGLESKIQEKPFQSLLIAAGVGLVAGFLWKRR